MSTRLAIDCGEVIAYLQPSTFLGSTVRVEAVQVARINMRVESLDMLSTRWPACSKPACRVIAPYYFKGPAQCLLRAQESESDGAVRRAKDDHIGVREKRRHAFVCRTWTDARIA